MSAGNRSVTARRRGKGPRERPLHIVCTDLSTTTAANEDGGYCTLAVTEALPVTVNVHVFALLPPLEHAPDQITSRVFEALSVTEVPVVNVAEPVLPTATLIPAGVDVTRSPLRPVAVTLNVAAVGGGAVGGGVVGGGVVGGGAVGGGITVSAAVCVTPPAVAVMVTGVATVTGAVVST